MKKTYQEIMQECREAKQKAEEQRLASLVDNWHKKYPNGRFVIQDKPWRGKGQFDLFWFNERLQRTSRVSAPWRTDIVVTDQNRSYQYPRCFGKKTKSYDSLEKMIAACQRSHVSEAIVKEFLARYSTKDLEQQ